MASRPLRRTRPWFSRCSSQQPEAQKNCMNRRHSLPAEVYALVEHTPATVLLECGKQNNTNIGDPAAAKESCTRIFTAPLRVYMANDAAEIACLFREIENAVAVGQTAAGFFTYESGKCFEPKAGMRESSDG